MFVFFALVENKQWWVKSSLQKPFFFFPYKSIRNMEAEEVGERTDNNRAQCDFRLSHKFYSQDAFAKNKIKTENTSQGLWKKMKLAPTKCSQTHFFNEPEH